MNKFIQMATMAAVGVILVMSLLLPIVDTSTAATRTYINEGQPYAAVDEDTHILTFNGDNVITLDGETVDISKLPADKRYYTVVFADNAYLRMDTVNKQLRVVTGAVIGFNYANATVTVTIAGDAATISTTESETTASASGVTHYIANSGDWVLSENPCIVADSDIYGAGHTGYTTPTNLTIYGIWSGDKDNVSGAVLTYVPSADYTSVVMTSATPTLSTVETGLYKVDKVDIVYTSTDAENATLDWNAVFTYFLAPASVTYANPDLVSDDLASLLNLLPLLCVVGLVLAIVAYVVKVRA